jgi:cytochrome c
MQNAFWFYTKFMALLGVVLLMMTFNFITQGFDEQRHAPAWQLSGAQPNRGAVLIENYGCASCHAISGISTRPIVGPSLLRLPDQLYIAGKLANAPQNLIQWIQHPERVRPGTAMPNLNVGDEDARDIAAYLLEGSR